jgi:hypothetical protein
MSEQDIVVTGSKCDTCGDRCGKLDVFDWLADLPESVQNCDIVEVQFKNTRKGYYKNSAQLKLAKGENHVTFNIVITIIEIGCSICHTSLVRS